MKIKKLLMAGIAVTVIAAGAFYAYDSKRFSDVEALLEKDALLYSSTETALSLALYKAEVQGDPLRGYYAGFQTELAQLHAEYDALVAEEPFIKLSYTDKLIEWNSKRADLFEKIEDFLE